MENNDVAMIASLTFAPRSVTCTDSIVNGTLIRCWLTWNSMFWYILYILSGKEERSKRIIYKNIKQIQIYLNFEQK